VIMGGPARRSDRDIWSRYAKRTRRSKRSKRAKRGGTGDGGDDGRVTAHYAGPHAHAHITGPGADIYATLPKPKDNFNVEMPDMPHTIEALKRWWAIYGSGPVPQLDRNGKRVT
jgi:hypothetical protein